MEQMNATVLEVSRNAEAAAGNAEQSREHAMLGSSVMERRSHPSRKCGASPWRSKRT
jgi:hypothetical protein